MNHAIELFRQFQICEFLLRDNMHRISLRNPSLDFQVWSYLVYPTTKPLFAEEQTLECRVPIEAFAQLFPLIFAEFRFPLPGTEYTACLLARAVSFVHAQRDSIVSCARRPSRILHRYRLSP